MMKKKIIKYFGLLSLFVFGFLAAQAHTAGLKMTNPQQNTITGKITDVKGTALPNVVVRVLSSKISVSSSAQGEFSIKAAVGDTLQFSFIGFDTQQQVIKNTSPMQIVMKENTSVLSEIVVVGYGTQKKSAVSGAVAEVGLDKIGSRSINNVGEALQGKAPGVIVTNEGGDPTASPRVNIRGMGGINGERPLYVVDGSIFSGTPMLNPNDIATISVLKDASAAIYGARASGGVVLITTKKGKKGALSFNFDAKIGTQSAWRKLQPLNAAQKAQVINLAYDNAGKTRDPAYDAAIYPDGQITRTNWMDEIFQKGMMQDYDFGVNGGTDKSNFYLSFNYRKAEGILLNTYSQRYNFRINSEHQITNWFKFGENFSYVNTNGNSADTQSGYTGALLSAIYYPSNVSPYTATGAFSGLPAEYAGSYGDVRNPVAYLKRLDIDNPSNQFVINPYIEISLLEGLKFKSNLSITKSFAFYKQFQTRIPEIGKPNASNQLEERNSAATDVLMEQTLSYDKNIEKHHINAVAGFTFQKTTSRYSSITGVNFDDESSQYRYMVNANELINPVSTYIKTAITSNFIRVNYDYDTKYLLSATLRRDATSLLSNENNRAETYYALSTGWLLSKENFMKNITWLNLLKIRGSYGILGNLGSLSQQAVSPLLNRTTVFFGQDPVSSIGYYETILANANLKWANSKQTNIGLDAGFFHNRLNLTADYFIKDIDRMILTKPLSGTTGLSSQTVNAGLVRDQGIELGINYSNDAKQAFQYSLGFTFTKLKNKVISLTDGLNSITPSTNFRSALNPIRIEVGQPLYSYYVIQTAGIFKTDDEAKNYKNAAGEPIQPNAKAGDFRFVDANNDGKISTDDRKFMGSAYPSFTYGLSFNASYHNFDINIFAQGVYGNKVFNAVKFSTLSASGAGQPYNMLVGILDAWSPQNPNATLPIVSASDANGNFSNTSDFYLESSSYLRIKNVTLGYTFPDAWTEKLKVKGLRLYVTANNLLTFTKYSGFDPEIGMDNSGLDAGRYPQARAFMAGLSIKF